MVLTLFAPAVLSLCHCCGPVTVHEAMISGPGMGCCDMVTTAFRECAPTVQKHFAVLAAVFVFLVTALLPFLAGRFREEAVETDTGPPFFHFETPLYLSLKTLRI